MKTVKIKGKVFQEPNGEKDCDFLICKYCSFYGTSKCYKCAKTIKKLKAQVANLKKKNKKLEDRIEEGK